MNTKLVKASGISSLIVPVIAFVSSIAAVESKSEDWESVGGLVLASLNLVVGFIRMAMIHVDHTYCTEPQTNVHALLKFIYPWKFYVHGRLVSCRGESGTETEQVLSTSCSCICHRCKETDFGRMNMYPS